ncbi:MAG: PilW family protein, partial [Endozoicomonas sp.]
MDSIHKKAVTQSPDNLQNPLPFTESRAVSLTRQSGVSLIELLIAITLSLFLLTGVAVLYWNVFIIQNDSSRAVSLNDSARAALTIISRQLRSVGYYSGLGSGSVNTNSLGVSNDCTGLASALNTTTSFMAGRSGQNIAG